MAITGKISINSPTDLTASRSFTGTSAADDYVELSFSAVPLFVEFYLNNLGNLTYAIDAVSLGKSVTYNLAKSSPANEIEGFQRSGSSVESFNGLSLIAGPGDYSTQTSGYSFYGTTGNDTIIAPLNSLQASNLQGWTGDDTLIGGNGENTFQAGPGKNEMQGKNGADTYRSKTEYMANDAIIDDGTDGGRDALQVLLTTKIQWDWSFTRLGNDLIGVVNDAAGSYNFISKNQYLNTNSGLEGLTLFAQDHIGVWRGVAFKAANSATWSAFGEAGTSASDTFMPDKAGLGAEKDSYRAWGQDGNDLLYRWSNKNAYSFFDGGDGIDTVVYNQARSAYTITKYASSAASEGFTVRNNTAPSTVSPDNMTRVERFIFSEADSSTRCNKDEPGDGWLRMSRHHGHSNRQVQVARCTSTSAEKNDTKFTAS